MGLKNVQFLNGVARKGACGVKKKFQKTLTLAFEVIVQPPKHKFEIGIFSTF